MDRLFNSVSGALLGFLDTQWPIAFARLRSLFAWRQIKKLWGILVLLAVVALSNLPGFQPLYIVGDGGNLWFRWVLFFIYMAWTVWMVTFLQRDDTYTETSLSDEDTILVAEGNKGVFAYLIALGAWVFFVLLEYFITGRVELIGMTIAGVIQLLPIFMGNILNKSVKYLGPFVTNIILVVTAMVYIAFG